MDVGATLARINYVYIYFSRESHELLVHACQILQYRKSKDADIWNFYDHPLFLNSQRAVDCRVHPYHYQTDPISCDSRFKSTTKTTDCI